MHLCVLVHSTEFAIYSLTLIKTIQKFTYIKICIIFTNIIFLLLINFIINFMYEYIFIHIHTLPIIQTLTESVQKEPNC